MLRNCALVLFILFTGLSIFLLAQETMDVSGDWELKVEVSRGEIVWQVSFAQNGQDLKVKMTGPQGKMFEGQGNIAEDKIEWSVVRPTPRGDKTFAYKGTIEGITMHGELLIEKISSSKWTAARKTK